MPNKNNNNNNKTGITEDKKQKEVVVDKKEVVVDKKEVVVDKKEVVVDKKDEVVDKKVVNKKQKEVKQETDIKTGGGKKSKSTDNKEKPVKSKSDDNKKDKKVKKDTDTKEKQVKTKKVINDDDNEEEEEIILNGKHIRSFKVKLPESEKYEGRFTGLTPYQAANKALSKFFREANQPDAEITFSICESTRKSKKSTYTYVGRRLQLEVPVKYKIQDGREIVKNFKNSLKKVKKSDLVK